MLTRLFITLAVVCISSAPQAKTVTAKCTYQTQYDNKVENCLFGTYDNTGSFSLQSINPNGKVFSYFDVVNVVIVAPGEAEVSGLNGAINSRWGHARRSTRDRACWVGSDFTVCAY